MWQQLTREERFVLAELLELKLPKTMIAARLGVARSTVYRELKRNSGPVGYLPEEAQQRTDVGRIKGDIPRLFGPLIAVGHFGR